MPATPDKSFLTTNAENAVKNAPPRLSRQIQRGMAGWRGIGKGVKGVEKAVVSGGNALLSPGQHPEILEGLGKAYGGLKGLPPGLLAVGAVGVPAAVASLRHDKHRMVDMMNESLQEGRQVLASDKEFLQKKIAEAKRAGTFQTDKTAGFGDVFGQILQGLGSNALGGGYSNFAKATGGAPAGNIVGGLLPSLGNTAASAIGTVANPAGGTFGYQLNRQINPLMDRVKADETFATNFFQQAGKEVASQAMGLLKDVTSKAVTQISNGPAINAMLQAVVKGDPILAKADPALLSKAYHSMANFAPTLAKDENAVRSFLRESVMAGNGPDYATIANLAKAEATITGKKV